MPVVTHTARVFKMGGSVLVTLPAWFRRQFDIEPDDTLTFTVSKRQQISVSINKNPQGRSRKPKVSTD